MTQADVFVEGFRPGVAERLGIGPDDLQAVNPRLVYARMTGWGQNGPLADRAGHDINYLAISSALEPIGHAGGRPVPPLNLVGDFGGGGLTMTMCILAALFERNSSGRGQVVDAAMVDGSSLLMSFIHGLGDSGTAHDHVQAAHPLRVDRPLRGERRVRLAGADTMGGAEASTQRSAPLLFDLEGCVQPSPAPRFERTPTETPTGPRDAADLLTRWDST
ncbi:MAG: CoA transferase [Candidatus Microthrix sp.]|nr:CoA transferase [Candidatus Microthrix sp.]MBP7405760.1 CoA transferase [Candidatus Microthrix sp.]MBP9067075.1 CoA transferase [Candidatus Microthrix sp.]